MDDTDVNRAYWDALARIHGQDAIYGYGHSLGEVVNAAIGAGLRIDGELLPVAYTLRASRAA